MARTHAIAPFFATMNATIGANIDKEKGTPTAGYAYPVLVAMQDQDADLVYNMTKAMVELYDSYNGNAPGIGGWSIDKQNFEWVAPYHDGAIKYYKEIGKWSDAAQAHNDNLVKRQMALKAGWDALTAMNPDDDAWAAAWDAKRREVLKAGGFKIVF